MKIQNKAPILLAVCLSALLVAGCVAQPPEPLFDVGDFVEHRVSGNKGQVLNRLYWSRGMQPSWRYSVRWLPNESAQLMSEIELRAATNG